MRRIRRRAPRPCEYGFEVERRADRPTDPRSASNCAKVSRSSFRVSRNIARVCAMAPISSGPAVGNLDARHRRRSARPSPPSAGAAEGDRAQHQEGQSAPISTAAVTTIREIRVAARRLGDDPLAGGDGLAGQLGDDRGEQLSAAMLCRRACASSELPITRRSSVYSSTAFSAKSSYCASSLRTLAIRSGFHGVSCRDAAPSAPACRRHYFPTRSAG